MRSTTSKPRFWKESKKKWATSLHRRASEFGTKREHKWYLNIRSLLCSRRRIHFLTLSLYKSKEEGNLTFQIAPTFLAVHLSDDVRFRWRRQFNWSGLDRGFLGPELMSGTRVKKLIITSRPLTDKTLTFALLLHWHHTRVPWYRLSEGSPYPRQDSKKCRCQPLDQLEMDESILVRASTSDIIPGI